MSERPAELRPASTLLLIRDRAGLEVLMIKRNRAVDFAAGAMVFPGGKVCADDRNPEWAKRVTGDDTDQVRAFKIAAIREVFEETGVLLARTRDGLPIDPARVARFAGLRAPIDVGEARFSDLIIKEDLVLDSEALIKFGNWLTPKFMPKRFDTLFYIAEMPKGQVATADGREATEIAWMHPSDALAAAEDGRATIIFPTRMNLGRLALAETCGAAIARFSEDCPPPIEPVVDTTDPNKSCLVIPQVEGYPQTREPLERVRNIAKPKSD